MNFIKILVLLLLQLAIFPLFAVEHWDEQEQQPDSNRSIKIGSMTDMESTNRTGEGDYEYRIGPLDLIEVDVFQVQELGHTARVNSQGFISLPLIGAVNVKGLTTAEAEALIERQLSEKYLQDPHVTVFVREYESQKITIDGWVKDPGVFPLKGKTTLVQAISMANGLDRLADPANVVIFREIPGKGTVGYKLNFNEVRGGAIRNPVLQNNDIVVVPQNGGKANFEDTTKALRTFLGFLPFL